MQDRYTGDIGDYVKYALLRTLAAHRRLGVAWYLFPDEGHNTDGKHVLYLDDPGKWRRYDPELFDELKLIVEEHRRSVAAVERSGLLPGVAFASEKLGAPDLPPVQRRLWREAWFGRVLGVLTSCDLVFADPDNGLCADRTFRLGRCKCHKRMPLREALGLAEARTAIIYHHNSRFPGGHQMEIRHWLSHMPAGSAALYWRPWSPRTFFVIRPMGDILARLEAFARLWAPHACLVEPRV